MCIYNIYIYIISHTLRTCICNSLLNKNLSTTSIQTTVKSKTTVVERGAKNLELPLSSFPVEVTEILPV